MHEIKKRIEGLSTQFEAFTEPLNIVEKRKKLEQLAKQSQKPNLWDDADKAKDIMQELNDIKTELAEIDEVGEEIATLVELVNEDELSASLEEDLTKLEARLGKLELSTYLSGKYDKKNAIISLHAGQGGTEAMDWTSMLFRMYLRYAERKGWKYSVLEENRGEEAGMKSAIIKVSGGYAYGYLKNESGAHRLVRQSPFNADSLRQTSFSLVEVMPELDHDDTPDIEIRNEDLEIQFFRAGGHGGQNVNKVSTAVRLTHIPSKIVVSAQTERYQEANRKIAMNLLRSKLWAIEEERRKKEEASLKGEYTPATWGTQIRSYVLHPYKMVKDLRTEVETNDAESVLDGDLDQFVEAEVRL